MVKNSESQKYIHFALKFVEAVLETSREQCREKFNNHTLSLRKLYKNYDYFSSN